MLGHEERGDEEPREGEEHRDADVTTTHPSKASVEEQHHRHSDCTNTVERWLIRQPPDG